MPNELKINVFSKEDFRNWLEKNHDKEIKVGLIIHKKHTGKSFPTHKELMFEAICFGWIDTTLKRLDENTYVRYFAKRNKNSKWSENTQNYAKQLIKEKRMTPQGLKMYQEGLKKPVHDFGVPKNPEPPKELLDALKKNKKANENFSALSPSVKRTYLRWFYRAKLKETRNKRLKIILERMRQGNKVFNGKDI